ncbi:MAG: ABC transporter permease [Bryobacteraceae bacterium]
MRSAVRSLRRRPAFALAAILTIALGVGANTALFGVIDAVLIQPLPFRDPGKLVRIWETHPALPQLQVTAPDFRDWRAQARSFEAMAAHTLSAMNTATLLGQGQPEIVHGSMASSDLFSTMGIQPIEGRNFSAAEEHAKQHVVVISENLWRRKFAADPAIAGKQVRLDKESFTVLGVVSQRQVFPEWADFWFPLSLMEPDLQNARKYHPLEVVARLKPGVTVEQAQTEIQAIARRLAQADPATNATVGAYVIPLSLEMTRDVRPSLLLAWSAVGLVLLMACANLAHLFLARMLERRNEMAIREALGASSHHLIRHILTESLVLAAAGGAAGVALAISARRLLPFERTAWQAPVWLYAIAISVVAGVLFGLPACWHVVRDRHRLTASTRSVARGRSRLGPVLLAGEIAMAFLVLAGATLLARNFAALLTEAPGFDAQRVLEIPNLPLRADWDQAAAFLSTQLAPALRRLPGIQGVAAVNSAPMSRRPSEQSRFATRFGVQGRVFEKGNFPVAQMRWVTPDYFQVLGIPLRRGRWLTDSRADRERVLVNETLARRFFPHEDGVGQHLILGVVDPHQNSLEIAGIVGDVRDLGLDQDVEPMFYSIATGPSITLLIKTASDPIQFAPVIREAIQSVDSEIPISRIQPLAQNVADSLARRRLALMLLGIFGAMAALLTAVGIYSLLAYSVNTRVRELGVRGAVGASRGDLVAMILREAALLMAPGLAVGLILALAFSSVMRSFVYRLSPLDPLSLASAAGFLIFLTMLSAWIPARRAAGVDPATALRSGN